ncbi:MAG: ABC transporter substrate-binding protein [Alphaproteobacteria bacterium]
MLLLAAGATAAGPSIARAQKPEGVWRVAYLDAGPQQARGPHIGAFRRRMGELGYVEGHNVIYETYSAEGHFERLPELARALIATDPNVMLAATTPGASAAKAATTKIPIVIVAVADPVGVGLVQSLARPGGNITGITNIVAELTGKRLELLRELVPDAARIAVLINPDDPNAGVQRQYAEAAARNLRVELRPVVAIRGGADLEPGFANAVREGAKAAIRMVDPLATPLAKQTAEVAVKYRLPVIHAFRQSVEAGGLIAYGTDLPGQFAQAADLVDKILKGAQPADLPVEQPTTFELVINLKTAAALGLTVPQSLLVRADELLE